MFRDQIEPKGRLVIAKECHACWYYFMLAYSSWESAGDGPESQIITVDPALQTPEWMERRFDQIARTVAMIYQLDSPEAFLPYFPIVEREAKRMSPFGEAFEIPFAILKPFGVGLKQ